MNEAGPPTPRRPSIETRFRSWTAEFSAVAFDEQRLKDAETIAASVLRRWGIIAAGLLVVGGSNLAGLAAVSWLALVMVVAISSTANLTVLWIVRSQRAAWWLIYCLAVVDILIVGAFTALVGPGGIVVGFLIAILPYGFNESGRVGDALAVLATLVYMGAATVHGTLVAGAATGSAWRPSVLVEALVFLAVAVALRRMPASLVERIRVTRSVMRKTEDGALGVRAPAAHNDELGFLEKSFNRMLDEIAGTVDAVQREMDEVVVLAEVLSQAAAGALASSESVSTTSAKLATEMAAQRDLAEGSREESTAAAVEASTLRERADHAVADARILSEAAEHGRSSVARAGDVLVAIGEEVHHTADSVHELSALSVRVGSFARTISRIARQTHVLALNAAIEAAHNVEAGEGFAAVADEVRSLAAEASGSAREVTDLIGDVLDRVEAVSNAMKSGEEKVHNVGAVAQQAQQALDDLQGGIGQIKELVEATAQVSKTQAERMAELASRMADVATISADSALQAGGAAESMAAQQQTIRDLKAVSTQLAELAERVRGSIARFSVVSPDDG